MLLLEGSDTQLKFHITQTEDGNTTDVDLTEYEKIILTIKYNNGIVEYEGIVDSEQTSYVIFDILSNDTNGKKGNITCDIWGVSGLQKNRFNDEIIKGKVLPSIKVPNEV